MVDGLHDTLARARHRAVQLSARDGLHEVDVSGQINGGWTTGAQRRMHRTEWGRTTEEPPKSAVANMGAPSDN